MNFLSSIRVEFEFEIPRDPKFQDKNPEVPRTRSKEWFESKGSYHLAKDCKEASKYLKDNNITKVTNLKIIRSGIFTEKSVCFSSPMTGQEAITKINEIASKYL